MWNRDSRPVDRSILDKFTDTLIHRGPDGRGTYVDTLAGLGLGHRRLSILDTCESGRQPMSYAGGRYWISYNGEIYNFLELRNQLEGMGHQFASEADTEVVLAAFAQWGEECQLRFNGMWAFAIWDREKQILFLSRDRFGVKPLFYAVGPMGFAFASEMKAFLALPWVDKRMDPETVAMALENPSVIDATEWCLMVGAKRLLGGHSIIVQAQHQLLVSRWWNTLEHIPDIPRRFEEQADGLRDLFLDACRIRMRSDVPICASLSGGMDSSSILSGMSFLRATEMGEHRQASEWQRAFIASFPGTLQDELEYAREVVRHTGVSSVEFTVDGRDVVENLDSMIFSLEELYWEIPVGPWLLYRSQRANGVYVSIDGHGGDELLAGYPHYVVGAMHDAMRPVPNLVRYSELRHMLLKMHHPGADMRLPRLMELIRKDTMHPIRFRFSSIWRSLNRAKGASATIAEDPPLGDQRHDSQDEWLLVTPRDATIPNILPNSRSRSRLFVELWRDTHMSTLPAILRIFDRCSMAHGVEVRCPFLDWRLVCFAFALPSVSKIGGGFTKRVLREAMKGILPENIRTRTHKIGFASPLKDWLGSSLRSFMLDTTATASFLGSNIWNGRKIRADVEHAYELNDLRRVGQALRYVQADRLANQFKEHTNA